MDAGSVDNTATGSALPAGSSTTIRHSASTSTATSSATGLELDKRAGTPLDANNDHRVDAGDTIDYTFEVTNTGDLTLTATSVQDGVAGPVTCPAGALVPGASATCTATLTVTQAQTDAGSVENTATATARAADDSLVTSAPDSTSTPTSTDTVLTLAKQAGRPTDVNGNGRVDAGDTIGYTFTLTNAGATTLTGLAVLDPRLDAAATCPRTTLAPGAALTCSGTHTITQAEVDAGRVDNTATAQGTDPSGATITSAPASTTTTTDTTATLTMDKSAAPPVDTNGDGRIAAGDTITYTFTLTNTGAVTLSLIDVEDVRVGAVTCTTRTIAPREAAVCTATHRISQAEVDAGSVDNVAYGVARTPGGTRITSPSDQTSGGIDRSASLGLDKQADAPTDTDGDGRIDDGDTIGYRFVITNTGTVTVAAVAVDDPNLTQVLCPVTTLAPGANTVCTGTGTITQAQVDAGAVVNTATATGTDPDGAGVRSAPDSTRTPTDQSASLVLDKQAGTPNDVNGNGRTDVGDTVPYVFSITNTGALTLAEVRVSDPRIFSGVSCPTGGLAPGATVSCTGLGTITQADVDAGSSDNTATAAANRPDGTSVTSASDSTSTATSTRAALALDKQASGPIDANGDGRTDAGDTITYSFTLTNGGDRTLRQVAIADALADPDCPTTTLVPGQQISCTATYTLTQDDLDTGAVANTATATAVLPDGSPLDSPTDSTSTPLDQSSTLSLTKAAADPVDVDGDGRADAGDTIAYTLVVTNTGTLSLDQIEVEDPAAGAVACPGTTLAPGASITCTASITISQADVDRGSVLNTAEAVAQDRAGRRITSAAAQASTPLDQTATLTLDKQAGDPVDANNAGRPDGRLDAGDTIAYTFVLTNTGAVTLTGLTVSDPTLPAVSCPTGPLAPGASSTCRAGYVLTQADLDAGTHDNTATASAGSPSGLEVNSGPDSTSTPLPGRAALSLTKQAGAPTDTNADQRIDAGDTIAYTFTLTNTGTVTLTDLTVLDSRLAGAPDCLARSLAPGAGTDCRGDYRISQDDVDAGTVDNSATATGLDPSGTTVDAGPASTSTPLSRTSSLTVDKQASPPVDVDRDGRIDSGDRIDYTFLVTDTGVTTLTDVAVVDPLVGAVACPTTTLAPGTDITCTASYTLTQADVDAGGVTNTATAAGTGPDGLGVSAAADSTSTPASAVADLSVDKRAGVPTDVNGNGRVDAGDTIDYTITVTNTGAVSLDLVGVDDALTGATGCSPTRIAPGEAADCPTTYTITQADVDAGSVSNVATGHAVTPDGTRIESASDVTSSSTDATATMTLDKRAGTPVDANGNGRVDAGDTIGYTFVITNTGALTLTEVGVDDPSTEDPRCDRTTLPPADGQDDQNNVATCTVTYEITQADVDAGSVDNRAVARATGPGNRAVASDPDTTSVPTSTVGGLSIDKRAGVPVDVNHNGQVDAGDTIGYTFAVTNVADTTIRQVRIDDPELPVVDCPDRLLRPAQVTDCTGTYVITQADVDAGTVDNSATATGVDPFGGAVRSPSDATSTPTSASATLTLDKQAGTPTDGGASGAPDGLVDAGDTIAYTFLVTNTGVVTLSALRIDDPRIQGPIACDVTALRPGASTTCRARYTITQTDVDTGAVVNAAVATATTPADTTVASDSDQTTTPTSAATGLSLDKVALPAEDVDGDGRVDAGDTVRYTFTLTNTGVRTLTGLRVDDPRATPVSCPPTALAPGASTICTASATITQAEVDAGSIDNTATASGIDPSGRTVISESDSTSTPTATDTGLRLGKRAGTPADTNGNGRVDAGDQITYTFRLTNTGAQTLHDVVIDDPRTGPVTCPTTLAAGDTVVCQILDTISQDDVDAGAALNSASATGRTPADVAVRSNTDSTSTPTSVRTALRLDKRAERPVDVNRNDRVDAGDRVGYLFVVTNTGDLTVHDVRIDDPRAAGLVCPVGNLAPGDTTRCTGTSTITQADVDAGALVNTATAAATDPNGMTVVSAPDTETTPTTRITTLALDKQAGTPVDVGR